MCNLQDERASRVATEIKVSEGRKDVNALDLTVLSQDLVLVSIEEHMADEILILVVDCLDKQPLILRHVQESDAFRTGARADNG